MLNTSEFKELVENMKSQVLDGRFCHGRHSTSASYSLKHDQQTLRTGFMKSYTETKLGLGTKGTSVEEQERFP